MRFWKDAFVLVHSKCLANLRVPRFKIVSRLLEHPLEDPADDDCCGIGGRQASLIVVENEIYDEAAIGKAVELRQKTSADNFNLFEGRDAYGKRCIGSELFYQIHAACDILIENVVKLLHEENERSETASAPGLFCGQPRRGALVYS